LPDTYTFVSPMRDRKNNHSARAGRVERIYEVQTDSLIYDYVDGKYRR